MDNWLAPFVIIIAVAFAVQTAILIALFLQLRRTHQKFGRVLGDLQAGLGPILTRVQIMLEETQPRVSNMVADAAHVVYLARSQAQKVDRLFTEAADRLRSQLNHVDRILTGVMETLEDAGSGFRRNFWEPMQKATAVIRGVKAGLDFFRTRREQRPEEEPAERSHEEELFI